MAAGPHLSSRRERGVALIIVLAFVVLLTGLAVAYLSRTTSDRQVAHSSFNQSKGDQLAASAMDLVIGGLRQEITGPSPTPTPPYVPATNAGMLPVTFGNPDPTGIPNLIRRSVYGDGSTGPTIPSPGVPSLASGSGTSGTSPNNSTTPSANGRSITLARWNKHYLVPKLNTGNDQTDPVATFVAPDWVILTRAPANPNDPTSPYPVAFPTWNSVLADQTPTNNLYAVGRFAYAIYDEGSLLDANVIGYPSGSTAAQAGRKGPVAYADMSDPAIWQYPIPNGAGGSAHQVDWLVGWRNYGTTGPNNNFPGSTFAANLQTAGTSITSPAYLYWQSLLNRTAGFTTTSGAVSPTNGRSDQMFSSRQQLIAYRAAGGLFNVNALQYLTTFSRELNAPSWKPSTPAGSSIDYAGLANTATAINRDLLNVRVKVQFTRLTDGTTANVGDLLIKQRFPLSRINGLADPTFAATTISTIDNGFLVPATAATVQRDFGLTWNNANNRWDYVGYTGSTVQTAIKTLDQVATDNREPNFFELLKAGILSGSVGMGSGTGSVRTFVNAETKYYSTVAPTRSDYQIMQIGANIIDQWDSDNIPTFINFGGNELAGIENLPYLNKLVFKPAWTVIPPKGPTPTTYTFDAWLLPSLWNPHQNAPPSAQNVRIAMTAGTLTATLNPSSGTVSSVTSTTPPFMTVDASKFGTSPSAPTAATIVTPPSLPSSMTPPSTDAAPGPYYGFHVALQTPTVTAPASTSTASPNFGAVGAGCTFELQVQVSTSPIVWKAYQKWTGCAQPATALACAPASWLSGTTPPTGLTTYQDPEFVTLDPRTLRFGVWGNDAVHSGSPSGIDYTTGVLTTLERSAGVYETITALPPQPQGTNFTYTGPPYALYNYAKNLDATTHYTDSDTLQRQGDIISGTTTAMLPTDFVDRPQILNRPFQSLAELGQVFRDQPWKTLDFTTASSPDVGLLDVFTLHESANEAGKTSLNTRYKFILTAILSNAIKRLAGTNADVITTAQRGLIVTDLFNITSTNPMIRKTDLLAQLAADPNVTSLGNKEARELVMRAFSDATQTRTWNLLIDVVAQSGRYPPNASTLAGFLVEGEQHYWVHVAIDRFTGQVIDKQIEVVNE
jgi:hypothetical protein